MNIQDLVDDVFAGQEAGPWPGRVSNREELAFLEEVEGRILAGAPVPPVGKVLIGIIRDFGDKVDRSTVRRWLHRVAEEAKGTK